MNAPRHRPLATCLLLSTALLTSVPVLAAPPFAEFVDPNPNPGNQFGAVVLPLSTGNVVITSPNDDAGGTNAGAVYLFNGATGALISTLRGSSADDQVGSEGVIVLSSGNYLVPNQSWSDGKGAVTWCSGISGVEGVVSSSNSLVGSAEGNSVGYGGVTLLTNGNYVVRSQTWDNGGISNVGAVTWGSGSSGVSGVVSSSNSLVGTTSSNEVGSGGVTALTNGNYVVISAFWDNGAVADVGAVTWCNGTSGRTGAVTSSNSLVGTTANSRVGFEGVKALSNGNYVVNSWQWRNGAATFVGAVTWGDGSSGVSGAVSSSNSLVGTAANHQVGLGGVTVLTNGNYVVNSQFWDNGSTANVGAVTWGSGNVGVKGEVSSANSLTGSKSGDRVGVNGVMALSNGNYLVRSSTWDNGTLIDVGAVTWGSGTTGIQGGISSANSLIGSSNGDNVGQGGIVELTNGNYVVQVSSWDNGGVLNVGAVTWGSGTSGISGVVSSSNSLVGSKAQQWELRRQQYELGQWH